MGIAPFLEYTFKMLEVKAKVREVAEKIIEVTYEDLVNHYQETMNQVYDFLQLPPIQASPLIAKQQDWNIRSRIANFEEFAKKLPKQYKSMLENML